MKITSVNIGEKQTVSWRGKSVQTGIYKFSVDRPIVLGKTDVEGDNVIDRKYHGGADKACYLYSKDHYAFWKEKYPHLDWSYGMFGENITVDGLNEAELQIGDILYLGECRVQVSQPRQPCFKLGIRFETQKVLKEFINAPYPGVYVKVIQEGAVQKGDHVQLSERLHDSIGLLEVWDLLYGKNPDKDLLEFAAHFQHLGKGAKDTLLKKLHLLD
ncbi:MAG: MOSC domain-containing protein [Crocinitomix sp.]|nr:MOSC domain-containing protein [Crocinitomix sp.]